MIVLNLALERCVVTDVICVKGGAGMLPEQAIDKLLLRLAYKFDRSGYRRALFTKYALL